MGIRAHGYEYKKTKRKKVDESLGLSFLFPRFSCDTGKCRGCDYPNEGAYTQCTLKVHSVIKPKSN
jgi:hypothetical protein